MKFDFCIGNPPYQEETDSESTRTPPIYDKFMNAAYEVADKVEVITPARFLFDAGYTPKAWNQQMLNDPHFKVLHYEQNSAKIFRDTDIKGGIAISYRDNTKEYGAIGTFTSFTTLNDILKKVYSRNFRSLADIAYPALSYKASKVMTEEHQELLIRQKSKEDPNPKALRLRTSAFEKLPELFTIDKPDDGHSYIQMLGLKSGKRELRWVDERYVVCPDNFKYYKIIIPKSNGTGAIGEVLATPLIGEPLIGHTQTFISIGKFGHETEARNCLSYIKSKFARTMLGILKITQDNPPEKWKYVPLQDFTSSSDIDWTTSIADIDRQLYQKYKLSAEEIAFIETHVKEMA